MNPGSKPNETIYTYSEAELNGVLAGLKRANKRYQDPIQRYKGLGEMDADQLANNHDGPALSHAAPGAAVGCRGRDARLRAADGQRRRAAQGVHRRRRRLRPLSNRRVGRRSDDARARGRSSGDRRCAALRRRRLTALRLLHPRGRSRARTNWPVQVRAGSSDNGVLFQFAQDVFAGRPLDWSFSPQVFVFPEIPISLVAYLVAGGTVQLYYLVVARSTARCCSSGCSR